MTIRIKRAYDPVAPEDGVRILVDRYWPRGVREANMELEAWLRDVAPSPELVAWFGHKRDRWEVFKARYWQELAAEERAEAVSRLQEYARKGPLTLVFGARDRERNNAQALAEYLAGLVPDVKVEGTGSPPLKDRTPPGPLARIALILQPDWFWLLFALSIPILILVIGASVLAFGMAAWLVVGAGFASLAGGAMVKALSQERRQRATMGGPPQHEAASIWMGVAELGVSVGSFIGGMALLLVIVTAFMWHAGYMH